MRPPAQQAYSLMVSNGRSKLRLKVSFGALFSYFRIWKELVSFVLFRRICSGMSDPMFSPHTVFEIAGWETPFTSSKIIACVLSS